MTDVLIALAILPGVLLLVYIYKLDANEKEPGKLLLKLFFFGCVSCIPAIILELIAERIIGTFWISGTYVYSFIEMVFGVALVEEGCKYFFIKQKTWKHQAFDYTFDAIVYSVFVSLGFAILENIMYVVQNGLGTAIMRALTAVPGHTIFAIYMGHYYGYAKMYHIRGDKKLEKKNKLKALWIPVAIHGIYDFMCSQGEVVFTLIFFVGLIALEIYTFKKVRKYAKADERLDGSTVDLRPAIKTEIFGPNGHIVNGNLYGKVKPGRIKPVVSEGAGDLPHFDCFSDDKPNEANK